MVSGGVRRKLLYRLATSDGFERLVKRLSFGEAWTRRAADRYVAGKSEEDALRVARDLHGRGIASTLDYFGERVTDRSEAESATRRYLQLAKALAKLPDSVWLAIDLSHVGLDISEEFCHRQVEEIVQALPTDRRLQVGAEEASRNEIIHRIMLAMAKDGAPLMATLQANLRRSPKDAETLIEAGIPVRLVKGAYVDAPAVALPWGDETDLAFIRIARQLQVAKADFSIATHDPVIREALLAGFDGTGVEMLLGVREQDAADLVRRGVPVRVYAPFGDGWFRYWMRRVAESQGA